MTSYHIKLGYNGANRTDYEQMWIELKESARLIADMPSSIIAEARRLGAHETCSKGCCELDTYAENYKAPFNTYGHPITVKDEGNDKQIIQFASTDDEIKYEVRRAYVRLLISEMHQRGIEVNLTVA